MWYLLHKFKIVVSHYIWRIIAIGILMGSIYLFSDPIQKIAQQGITVIQPVAKQLQDYVESRINPQSDISKLATEIPVLTNTPDTITITSNPQYIYVTVTSAANIRTQPDKTSSAVGTAQSGDQLIVLAQNTTGSWYKVRFDDSSSNQGSINSADATGWISSGLVTPPEGIIPVETVTIPTAVSIVIATPNARLAVTGKHDPDVRRDESGNVLICVSLQIRNRDATNWTFTLEGVQQVATFTQVQGASIADAAVCEGVEFRNYTMRIYDKNGNIVPGGTASVTGGFIYEATWIEK